MLTSLRVAIDPLFQPNDFSSSCKRTAELLTETKYELVFDERVDGPELVKVMENQDNVICK